MDSKQGEKKQRIKFLLTKEMFNTLFEVLTFFIFSEERAGETLYSFTSKNLDEQFKRYGKFIKGKNGKDDIFLIYLYDDELVQVATVYNKYIAVHQTSIENFYDKILDEKEKNNLK